MAETNIPEKKLNSVTNETDPKVIFDPKFEKPVIKKYIVDENESTSAANGHVNPTKIEGVIVPIVKINNQVISHNDIINVQISCTGFLPTIKLIVNNVKYFKLSTPGMVNKLSVIILPPIDGAYRKISLDFYITDMVNLGSTVVYSGDFFLPELKKKFTKAIKTSKNVLNTYELFEEIAKTTKLGFASTKQIKEIDDSKIRLMRSQTYTELLIEHLSFSGVNNETIFTSWIDLYGYLVLCNISWVLAQKTEVADYSMHTLDGINLYDETIKGDTVKFGEDTFRNITNWRLDKEKNNNKLLTYEWIYDNNSLSSFGTDNMYYNVNHIVSGGNNNILSENIIITEDTKEGELFKDYYTYQKEYFLGIEMASSSEGNTPVLFQEKRRTAYLTKINSKKLKVYMTEPNFGLNRGFVIQVSIFEYDRELKAEMLRNVGNTSKEGDTTDNIPEQSDEHTAILNNENIGVINTSISGMYYITGIEYIYEYGKLNQVLYLIKRDINMAYINTVSIPKFSKV